MAVCKLRAYLRRAESTGGLPGMCSSAGLFPGESGKLLRSWEVSEFGAADLLRNIRNHGFHSL